MRSIAVKTATVRIRHVSTILSTTTRQMIAPLGLACICVSMHAGPRPPSKLPVNGRGVLYLSGHPNLLIGNRFAGRADNTIACRAHLELRSAPVEKRRRNCRMVGARKRRKDRGLVSSLSDIRIPPGSRDAAGQTRPKNGTASYRSLFSEVKQKTRAITNDAHHARSSRAVSCRTDIPRLRGGARPVHAATHTWVVCAATCTVQSIPPRKEKLHRG